MSKNKNNDEIRNDQELTERGVMLTIMTLVGIGGVLYLFNFFFEGLKAQAIMIVVIIAIAWIWKWIRSANRRRQGLPAD